MSLLDLLKIFISFHFLSHWIRLFFFYDFYFIIHFVIFYFSQKKIFSKIILSVSVCIGLINHHNKSHRDFFCVYERRDVERHSFNIKNGFLHFCLQILFPLHILSVCIWVHKDELKRLIKFSLFCVFVLILIHSVCLFNKYQTSIIKQ